MTEIRLTDVTKTYGDTTALDEVSLTIPPGEFHCLVGPNGSGKTTLFNILLGLTRPTSGNVHVPADVMNCGFQDPRVYPSLTVAENLDVFAELTGCPSDEWLTTVVEGLGLDRVQNRRAGELSGGYTKALDLGLALVSRPQFLLLDEPLADLDDVTEAELLAFLDAYQTDDRTVFVSTHNVDAFADVVTRLTVLDRGTIAFDDAPAAFDGAAAGAGDSIQQMYVEMVADPTTDVDADR